MKNYSTGSPTIKNNIRAIYSGNNTTNNIVVKKKTNKKIILQKNIFPNTGKIRNIDKKLSDSFYSSRSAIPYEEE